MTGQVKELLDKIILNQNRINPLLAEIFKTKLLLRGVNVLNYNQNSFDDSAAIEKIQQLVKELNINLAENILPADIAVSENKDVEMAINELKQKLGDKKFKVIIYFASYSYEQDAISHLMNNAFKDTLCVGCSSVGEYANGKLHPNAVVAMGIMEPTIKDISAYVIDNINDNYDVTDAFIHFKKHFKLETEDFDYEKYVGILIMDGLSSNQDKIISEIAKHTDVMFTGGAAADNLKMKETYQYYNDKTYTNAAILILMEPHAFQILKTQSFVPVGNTFKATKVNTKENRVFEFNNLPAANFYSGLISIPVGDIEKYFTDNTIGMVIGREPYIHTPRCVNYDDMSMTFYSPISKDAEVQLLKYINIIDETKRVINESINNKKEIAAVIDFNCTLRTQKIQKDHIELEYESVFQELPIIGFSTYGEYYVSLINQTSTMLILK